jgi:hypothetical protein
MTTALNVAVILAVITLVVGYAVLKELPRRRWEDPLRKKMRAQPLTFRAAVDLKIGAVDPMQSELGPVNVKSARGHVRGRVCDPDPEAPERDGLLLPRRGHHRRDGQRSAARLDRNLRAAGRRAVRIRIGRRKLKRQLWDALVSAGAHPAGPPPPL